MIVEIHTVLALLLVQLTGPDGQRIDLNPQEITSVREPRGGFDKEIHCLIHMADGKFIAVIETCAQVREKLGQEEQE